MEHAFGSFLNALYSRWYSEGLLYQDVLTDSIRKGVEDITDKYETLGIRPNDKDMFPMYNNLVHRMNEAYKAELIGLLKREDPQRVAYALKCMDITKTNIVLVLST